MGVCIQPYQFSGMTAPNDPNLVQWPQSNDPQMADCISIAGLVAGKDPTAGAKFYFSKPLTEPPKEWGPVTGTVVIDGINFYKPEVLFSEST